MYTAIRVVGCPDLYRTSGRQETLWLLVGGGWRWHGAMAFYLGVDSRAMGSEDALARGIANVVAEADTLGRRLDPVEIAHALREYQLARGGKHPRHRDPNRG